MIRLWHAFVDALLGEEPTVSLERFLAGITLVVGMWVLMPWPSFVMDSALTQMPEEMTGTIFALHGLFHFWSLDGLPKVGFCRRAALFSSALWTALTLIYLASASTRGLVIVPITSGFASAAFLLYLRLGLLYE